MNSSWQEGVTIVGGDKETIKSRFGAILASETDLTKGGSMAQTGRTMLLEAQGNVMEAEVTDPGLLLATTDAL
jgi:hypothetical protein